MNYGYKDDEFTISSLFYMNDGLIFTENKEDAVSIIYKLEQVSLKYGLTLNKNKCEIMIINQSKMK